MTYIVIVDNYRMQVYTYIRIYLYISSLYIAFIYVIIVCRGENMLRFAICDDEEYICSRLEEYINTYCDSKMIESEVDIFNTGESFISFLNNDNRYHIIFLDIELKKCNGIDVSKHIRNIICNEAVQIVYVSGKEGYDRQLFTFRPFCFIEKPFDYNKIAYVVGKYLRIYGDNNDIFHYKVGHDTFWIKLGDILYFKSIDRKIMIKTLNGDDSFYGALEKVEEQLRKHGFLSPHKSYLVNYRFIRSFRSDMIILTNNEEIPVAKSKRKEIAKAQIAIENGENKYD